MPSIKADNPVLHQSVGNAIFDFVQQNFEDKVSCFWKSIEKALRPVVHLSPVAVAPKLHKTTDNAEHQPLPPSIRAQDEAH